MPLSRPHRLLLLPCAAALAAALVGCSSDGSDTSSSGTPTADSTAPSATGSPVAGGKAVCSAYQEASTDLTAVKTHLKDHDLEAAHASLEDAADSMKALAQAVSDLSADLKAKLKPRSQEIADQAVALGEATHMQQFKAGLSVIELEAQQLTNDVRASITC
ncbi:hypothetical protein [Nocardioides mangrovi]|uniref:Lipoprotein n=1 Tax=Nocardioides mangrovi TaxID=2874580 RepID=A0ABS7UD65_9ACTN|nr:hypothetical protein [Nocardioides mangrovi]MBZ5738794.1 hypothetical protein [Nocardioides mangrovi]